MVNFNQINHYTSFLIQESLLRYLALDRKYTITDKGRQFLVLFNETTKLLTAPNDHDDDDIADDNSQVKNNNNNRR